MDKDEALFALLLREMEAIQDGIQSLHSTMFTIKGWCITIAAAATGVAVSSDRPALVLIGVATTLAFWFVDGYFKSIQRIYIRRDLEIGRVLAGKDPIAVLNAPLPEGGLYIPDLARRFQRPANTKRGVRWIELKGTVHEALKPVVFLLYVFVLLCLAIAWLILAL